MNFDELCRDIVSEKKSSDVDNDLIEGAARGKLKDVIKALEDGADANAREGDALSFAAKGGHFDIVKHLIGAGAEAQGPKGFNMALEHAAIKGHAEIAEFLIKHGADVRANKDAIIVKAVKNKNFDVVKVLINSGAY